MSIFDELINQLKLVDVKVDDVKILSDNKVVYKAGDKTFNVTVNYNINLNTQELKEKANASVPEVKDKIEDVFEANQQLVSRISQLPPISLKNYLGGTVSANASLASINPNQPAIVPDPGAFAGLQDINFEQTSTGQFKTTIVEDLLKAAKQLRNK